MASKAPPRASTSSSSACVTKRLWTCTLAPTPTFQAISVLEPTVSATGSGTSKSGLERSHPSPAVAYGRVYIGNTDVPGNPAYTDNGKSVWVTPVRPLGLMMGKIMPYFFLGIFELVMMLVVMRYAFSVPMR